MDEAQQYIDFVEGRLDEESLKEFTRNLATDSEFLSGFQNFLLITRTVSSHASKIKAPADLTDGLYKKLGFSLHPESDLATPASSPAHRNMPFLGGKFFKGLMSGVAVAALMSVGSYLLFRPGNNPAYHTMAHIPKVVASAAIVPALSGETQNKQSSHKNLYNSPAARPVHSSAEYAVGSPDSEIMENQTVLLPADNNLPVIAFNHYQGKEVPRENLYNTQQTVFSYSKPEDLNISVEFNNSAVWDIPHPEIAYKSVSPFNNLCLSLMYHFNSYLKAGLEVRQESYFFEYYGTEPDSILYKYQQHSNFTSYGIKLAYSPFQSGRFSPRLQLGAGFNPGGFALRPSLGFDYNLYPNLSVSLGAEYTRFWFVHQSQLNNTSKLGLNYGLIYNF